MKCSFGGTDTKNADSPQTKMHELDEMEDFCGQT